MLVITEPKVCAESIQSPESQVLEEQVGGCSWGIILLPSSILTQGRDMRAGERKASVANGNGEKGDQRHWSWKLEVGCAQYEQLHSRNLL